ncbi:MAG TPA: hypothetical protein VFQ63_00685 [Patescibacteria group bacterium]|nr:hypothetical protein [Patescibacteria group bacterium]
MNILQQFSFFASSILTLVGFSQEQVKENTNQLLLALIKKTLVDNLDTLSEEEEKQLIEKLKESTSLEMLEPILKDAFMEESYLNLFKKNAQTILHQFSQKVIPSVDSEKVLEISELLKNADEYFSIKTQN